MHPSLLSAGAAGVGVGTVKNALLSARALDSGNSTAELTGLFSGSYRARCKLTRRRLPADV